MYVFIKHITDLDLSDKWFLSFVLNIPLFLINCYLLAVFQNGWILTSTLINAFMIPVSMAMSFIVIDNKN